MIHGGGRPPSAPGQRRQGHPAAVSTSGGIPGLTPEQLQALLATAGADLYRTWDGRNWSTVTLTGFGDPFNYGFRNLVPQLFRLYFGFSNPFYGCQVWLLRSLW